jgi:hypothetical protein
MIFFVAEELYHINKKMDKKLTKDKLIVYMAPLARRTQVLYPPLSSGSEIAIDIPSAFVENSATALFGNRKILPLRFQGQQLLVSLPVGQATVTKNDASYSGSLESISPYEIVLQTDKELLRISNWSSVTLDQRFDVPKVALSYSLQDVSWEAEHTILIDSENSKVIGFQTIAHVFNNSGIIFNSLSDLILSFGKPKQEFNNKNVGAARALEVPKMMRMESKRAPIRDVDMVSEDQSSNIDYEISLGPQQLKTEKIFVIMDMGENELVSNRYFSHQLEQGNRLVQMGFSIVMDSKTIIPSGKLKAIEVDHVTGEPGAFLGATNISEFRSSSSQENFIFLIGQAKDVEAETVIQSQTVSGKRQNIISEITPSASPIEIGLDVTTLKITTTLINRLTEPIEITLNYAIPYQNVTLVDPPFTRSNHGKWKWDVQLNAEEEKSFIITIKYSE